MSRRRRAEEAIDELDALFSDATRDRGGVVAPVSAVPAVPEQETPPEAVRRERLRQLEQTIEQSAISFRRAQARHYREVGPALEEIRDQELYLEEGYASWLDYLDRRWEYSESHAYRFIDMGKVCQALAPLGDRALNALTAESHARELMPALKDHGDDATRQIWLQVTSESKKVTAERVAQVRDAMGYGRRPELRPGGSPIGEAREGEEVVEAELVDGSEVSEGRQAVAVLVTALDRQKRLYDQLGEGLIELALLAEPNRAEHLLRELGQYATRTAYRISRKAGKTATERDDADNGRQG